MEQGYLPRSDAALPTIDLNPAPDSSPWPLDASIPLAGPDALNLPQELTSGTGLGDLFPFDDPTAACAPPPLPLPQQPTPQADPPSRAAEVVLSTSLTLHEEPEAPGDPPPQGTEATGNSLPPPTTAAPHLEALRLEPLRLEPLRLSASTYNLLYVAYYGRPADRDGARFWADKLTENGLSYSPRNGQFLSEGQRSSYDRIVNDFGNSEESRRLYAGLTNEQSINKVYEFCFGRAADTDPLTGQDRYWLDKLEKNEISLSQLAVEVALGSSGDDLARLSTKICVADRLDDLPDGELRTLDCTAWGDQATDLVRNWLAGHGGSTADLNTLGQDVSQLCMGPAFPLA